MPVFGGSPVNSRLMRRFCRNKQGSAAIEFAFVAPMFFALLFAIIETSAVFFAGQYLETGTQDAARALLIDDVQSKGTKPSRFQAVDLWQGRRRCSPATTFMLMSDPFRRGIAITIVNPIDDDGNFFNNFKYQPPPPKSENTVVVRAFYQWPIFVTRTRLQHRQHQQVYVEQQAPARRHRCASSAIGHHGMISSSLER